MSWRAQATTLALVATLALVPGSAAAQEGDGPTGDGATVDKTAWWNEANVPIDTPAGIQEVPAPPNIPEHGIAVSKTAGETDKRAGIGIRPDADTGDEVVAFTMTVAEVTEPGANANADEAEIQACPITDFWGEARNGRQDELPSFDCSLAAPLGERDDDGVWTFDLEAVGDVWLDPFEVVSANGVLLVPTEDSPAAFQVVFDTSTIDVTFDFVEGADDEEDPFAIPDPVDSGGTGDFGAGSGQVGTFNPPAPSPSPPSGGGGLAIDDLPAPSDEPVDVEPTDDAGGDDDLALEPTVSADPGFLEGLPGPAFVGLLGLLALFYAMAFALGPVADPAAETTRRGAVSRALAARERSQLDPTGRTTP